MKKFFNEFKEFSMRGNVMDLAVGVIIGAAFQGVVKALTDNLLSPIIGLFAKQNLDNLTLNVFGLVELQYGAFLTALVNFVITAFVVFLLVRGMNHLATVGQKPEEPATPTTQVCVFCCSEISLQAVKCPHCTADLPEKVMADQSAEKGIKKGEMAI